MLCSGIKNSVEYKVAAVIKPDNEIQTNAKIVCEVEMRTTSTNKDESEKKLKNVLELICLKGLSVKKASEELEMTEEELKINLRSELIKYRKTRV
jgi:hypothetical protein